MDERDKRRVGEEIEPGGRPKAPGRLALLQRFVNTHNHEFPAEWDRLGTPEKARSWLLSAGLVEPGVPVSAGDAARLRDLREAIRSLTASSRTGRMDAASSEVVRAVSRSAPLRVTVDGSGRTELRAEREGVDGAIATLLGILHEEQLSGRWGRMKACRQCGYAFFDRSRNRSAVWCAMSICGNRTKNRRYYGRRRSSSA